MPATLTYPGVYIEEIPSGVRTISGMATSIGAFIGWAPKGNTTAATRVLSWSDFVRKFGGLDSRSLLGYAVYHFFSNGGQDAYIVRLAGAGATPGDVTIDTLAFTARSPGDWSANYAIAIKQRADDNTRFRVAVMSVDKDGNETEVEGFDNLSMAPNDARNAASVINARSSIVSAGRYRVAFAEAREWRAWRCPCAEQRRLRDSSRGRAPSARKCRFIQYPLRSRRDHPGADHTFGGFLQRTSRIFCGRLRGGRDAGLSG